jgi:hypothetical protein
MWSCNQVWWVGALLATLGCSDNGDTNSTGPAGGSSSSVAGATNAAGDHGDAGMSPVDNTPGDTGGASATGGTGPSGAGANGDDNAAGADNASAGAGGMPTPEACGPAASLNAQGALSAYPNISVTVVPATDFAVTSFNFRVIEDGDARGPLLKLFVELKNIGAGLQCKFIPDVTLDGKEIVTTSYGPAKHLKIGTTIFSTVDPCIEPGQTAVLSGVQRGITEDKLKLATNLSIQPNPSNLSTTEYLPATPPTIASAQVVPSQANDGYLLKGNVSYTNAVHNQGIRVYPRDSRKLLVDELLAFPGNLGAHAAGSSAPFETNATPCAFEDYLLFQSWIND